MRRRINNRVYVYIVYRPYFHSFGATRSTKTIDKDKPREDRPVASSLSRLPFSFSLFPLSSLLFGSAPLSPFLPLQMLHVDTATMQFHRRSPSFLTLSNSVQVRIPIDGSARTNEHKSNRVGIINALTLLRNVLNR